MGYCLNLSNFVQVLDAAHLASCQINSVMKTMKTIWVTKPNKDWDTLCSIYLSQYSLWKVSISSIYNIFMTTFFFEYVFVFLPLNRAGVDDSDQASAFRWTSDESYKNLVYVA